MAQVLATRLYRERVAQLVLIDSYAYEYAFAPNWPLPEMVKRQRRTFKDSARRDIVYDIQRYCSQQVYYVCGPSASVVAAWMPNVRDFGPNIGPDYGGRLMSAWLDKSTQ